ncbi:jg4460 [Pararge aegeria aegeria]|uniref:Jg4460 protein n=2 Tax=Pararge aegeria aegeria TaxID=348720 RepID=A0A8S4QIB5_9NEOP|nr:jg4460 [Pararge aegeria aegeria]
MWNENSPRGPEDHDPSGYITSHLKAGEDLHERGPREATFFRNDLAYTRENETLTTRKHTLKTLWRSGHDIAF